ncbi:MAG: DUF2807 domain-containing protein [Bacteroidetes bacterium]|nr:DUF2807 domain-containing protein [Bacteroidota bacterium]
MKKLFLIIPTILLFAFSSKAFASETKTYNFKDFTSVEVGSGMLLTITQSDSYSVEVNADKKDFEHLRVEKKGNTLKFNIKRDFFSFFGHRQNRIEVNIKMPSLTGLDLSGGSIGKITMDVSSKKFAAEVSGGSQLKGNLSCANIGLELSGGSKVEISGKGNDIRLEGSGGSIFRLKDFSVGNVDAELSGGSHATITMNGTLNTDQSGGSRIVYYGNATLGNTDFSGGSGVTKGK